MRKIELGLENLAKSIAKEHQLKCKTSWTQSFQANENDKTAVTFIKKAAKINGFELFEKRNHLLGAKILVCSHNTILAPCLDWGQE